MYNNKLMNFIFNINKLGLGSLRHRLIWIRKDSKFIFNVILMKRGEYGEPI